LRSNHGQAARRRGQGSSDIFFRLAVLKEKKMAMQPPAALERARSDAVDFEGKREENADG